MHSMRRWPTALLVILIVSASRANGTDLTINTEKASRTLTHLESIAKDTNGMMEVFYDYVEDGVLKGGRTIVPVPRPQLGTLAEMPPYNVYTLIDNGPSENRIDLVFVGDGYTAGDMNVYADHVLNVLTSFFNEAPLDIYANYFNVHVVEVTSNESGVDEPALGIYRDTALDMAFDCSGIDRLLCVNYSKAWTAAENARDVDLVLAVANTTRYGGAGYTKLSTLAGGNGAAVEVALHEYGHSFAGLADEYHYGDGTTYTGSEPTNPNVSIYNAASQSAQQQKWYRWLDLPDVDTFEGALYKQYGIYRPTQDSKMKALGYPFGPVNVEQFVFSVYSYVSVIDAVSPEPGDVFNSTTTFSVTPLSPVTHQLNIEWQIDGTTIPDANDVNSLCPDRYLAFNTVQMLTARVADQVTSVRDESKRGTLLTDQQDWLVWKVNADFTGDGFVDWDDLLLLIPRWLLDEPDYDIAPPGGDGIINFQDFAVLTSQWQAE